MNAKKLKFGLLAVILVGCMVLVFQYIDTNQTELVFASTSSSGIPARLIIPRLHLNIEIEEVTRGDDGAMALTQNDLNVGWDNGSSKPGENGTAVIYGAVSWKYGYTARFADLHFLEPQDIITILNDKEEAVHFVVRERRAYDLSDDVNKIITQSGSDEEPRLNLVTYDGGWDKISKSYSKRMVIFADQETSEETSSRLIKETEDRGVIALHKIYGGALMLPTGTSHNLLMEFLDTKNVSPGNVTLIQR